MVMPVRLRCIPYENYKITYEIVRKIIIFPKAIAKSEKHAIIRHIEIVYHRDLRVNHF